MSVEMRMRTTTTTTRTITKHYENDGKWPQEYDGKTLRRHKVSYVMYPESNPGRPHSPLRIHERKGRKQDGFSFRSPKRHPRLSSATVVDLKAGIVPICTGWKNKTATLIAIYCMTLPGASFRDTGLDRNERREEMKVTRRLHRSF